MGDYKELYHSATAKDDTDRVCCLVADVMSRLERENPQLYRQMVEDMEEIAYSITKEDAERIVRNMRPKGQMWSYQQIEEFCKTKGITENITDYYLVMNMAYNDYFNTASMYGLQKDNEFFYSLARDFIYDQDGKPHKVARYFAD